MDDDRGFQYKIGRGFLLTDAKLVSLNGLERTLEGTKLAREFKFITPAGPDMPFDIDVSKASWFFDATFEGTVEKPLTINITLHAAPNGDLTAPRRITFAGFGWQIESEFDPTAVDRAAELQASFERAWRAAENGAI